MTAFPSHLLTRLFHLQVVALALLLPALCRAQEVRPDSVAADTVSALSLPPFRGTFYSEANGIRLVLDLYEESLEVPGYSFFGLTNGYMEGDSSERLYGTWFLMSHSIKGNCATLRFTNDIGSDSQTVEFCRQADGTYTFHATGTLMLKKAVKRKLYKIGGDMVFRRR